MTDLIAEEVEQLQEKTDEEIMTIYASQLMGKFPSMITLKALSIVMFKRDLKPMEMIISLKYQDSDSNEKLIQVTAL